MLKECSWYGKHPLCRETWNRIFTRKKQLIPFANTQNINFQTSDILHNILESDSGGYVHVYLLGYDAV
jgi:hypothetical protein